MSTIETLRKVPLFADLPEADLQQLCAACHDETLAAGTTLFEEGDEGNAAYVITEGMIEVITMRSGREVLLAVRQPGEVIGEMALLQDEPRMASARARDDTALLVIPKPALADLLDSSPDAMRRLFDILLERLRATETQLRQSERMAQLGTLTAGVAHELNNPAAAVARAADQLRTATHQHAATARDLDDDVRALVAAFERGPGPRSAMERADLEATVEDLLEAAGLDEPWSVAADLVDAGLGIAELEQLRGAVPVEALGGVLAAIAAEHTVDALVDTIADGAGRISAIVRALKSYSFLDQAPEQEVDVTEGIEDTLVLLGARLQGIDVDRDYEPDLPRLRAHGSELNQVWTNLLDNAARAIEDRRAVEGAAAAGRITVAASSTDDHVIVTVTDDGVGIPAAQLEQVFDAFFTTRQPGQGTGLGLDISRRIVVTGHGGDLTVDSEPGRTTFTARLPRR